MGPSALLPAPLPMLGGPSEGLREGTFLVVPSSQSLPAQLAFLACRGSFTVSACRAVVPGVSVNTWIAVSPGVTVSIWEL